MGRRDWARSFPPPSFFQSASKIPRALPAGFLRSRPDDARMERQMDLLLVQRVSGNRQAIKFRCPNAQPASPRPTGLPLMLLWHKLLEGPNQQITVLLASPACRPEGELALQWHSFPRSDFKLGMPSSSWQRFPSVSHASVGFTKVFAQRTELLNGSSREMGMQNCCCKKPEASGIQSLGLRGAKPFLVCGIVLGKKKRPIGLALVSPLKYEFRDFLYATMVKYFFWASTKNGTGSERRFAFALGLSRVGSPVPPQGQFAALELSL